MSLKLRIILIIFSVVLATITTIVLRKGRMPIKYSLLWYFSAIIVFLVAVFQFTIEWCANLLGFATLSNLIVAIVICILLFLTMSLTIITSGQKKKITLLIQELSILKERISKYEKEK